MKIGSFDFQLGRKGKSEAEEFLRHSMDVYASMSSFQAVVEREASDQASKRQFDYSKPNRYKVVSDLTEVHRMVSVCDGRQAVEYMSKADQPATSYPAPKGISMASSVFMVHHMFCGTLLYQFFGGGENLKQLAQLDKHPIELGEEKEFEGETAVEVKFYGSGLYGNVVALIGKDTSLVYQIGYDSEPLMELMNTPEHKKRIRQALESQIAKLPPGKEREQAERHLASLSEPGSGRQELKTTETYRDIRLNAQISAETFDIGVPAGMRIVEHGAPPEPPVAIGEPAPDFTVYSVDGTPLKLSDLRGHVVFIDLWATWCGPCRKGLPDTARLAKEGAESGLCVLAISSDPAETIAEFLEEESLAGLPAYADTNGEVWAKYKVTGIPTMIVVDAEGNLVSHMVGLRPIGQIKAALREAGASGI